MGEGVGGGGSGVCWGWGGGGRVRWEDVGRELGRMCLCCIGDGGLVGSVDA